MDKAAGKKYEYDNETGHLLSVTSMYDGSTLNLIYNNGQLQKVTHSDGPFIVINYNDRGLINWVELKNDGDNEQGRYSHFLHLIKAKALILSTYQ